MSTKAYELVPALERSKLVSDIRDGSSSELQVTAVDCSMRHIFLGTSGGQLIHYVLDEKLRPDGRIYFQAHLQAKRVITKRYIDNLTYIPSLDRVLTLIDNTIHVFDVLKLELSSYDKIKNIQTYAVDEKDERNAFSKQVCLGSKKKHLQLYKLTADKWIHIRDIAIPEPSIRICLYGMVICLAMQTRYMMVRLETTQLLDLFPFNPDETSAFVKRIEKGEFLLAAAGDLGMFVASDGSSRRPPIQLKNLVHSLSYSSPYLVSLNEDSIAVHSVLDQQLKQVIRFGRGLSLSQYGDRVIVTSQHEVFALVPVPWQKQVENLIAGKRVEEALQLAQASGRTSGMPNDQYNKLYKNLLQKAGFIALSRFEYQQAQTYFTEGQIDSRELISLFPQLLPNNSAFTRHSPPLHEYADINQITRADLNKMEDCKSFLLRYLESTHFPTNQKYDVHSALLKIYAENDVAKLIGLISKGYHGDEDSAVQSLTIYGRNHALALFYQKRNQIEKSLHIWSRLVHGEIEDDSMSQDPLVELTNLLSQVNNSQVVFSYAGVILEKNQALGAQIFTRRSSVDQTFTSDSIMEFLSTYLTAQGLYLEFLIAQHKSQDADVHSRLVMVYLDQITAARRTNSANEDTVQDIRKKLQQFLESSSQYSINLIIGRLERDDWFKPEMAILYGKSGRDDKALDILLNQSEQTEQHIQLSLDYCIRSSEQKSTLKEKQKLFEMLLDLLLEKASQDERYRVAVIDLLNNPQAHFDAAKVADKVPTEWSVTVISKFLVNSVRSSLHNSRQLKIARRLAETDFYNVKRGHLKNRAQSIILSDNRRCDLCHQLFKDCNFTRQSNGSIIHVTCMTKTS